MCYDYGAVESSFHKNMRVVFFHYFVVCVCLSCLIFMLCMLHMYMYVYVTYQGAGHEVIYTT